MFFGKSSWVNVAFGKNPSGPAIVAASFCCSALRSVYGGKHPMVNGSTVSGTAKHVGRVRNRSNVYAAMPSANCCRAWLKSTLKFRFEFSPSSQSYVPFITAWLLAVIKSGENDSVMIFLIWGSFRGILEFVLFFADSSMIALTNLSDALVSLMDWVMLFRLPKTITKQTTPTPKNRRNRNNELLTKSTVLRAHSILISPVFLYFFVHSICFFYFISCCVP